MYSRGETANHAATSFFFYMSSPSQFCIALPAALPIVCVCAGFVFMTTPVIRRHCRAAGVNTAEVHYSHCCSCLLPGSRLCLQSGFFFFHFRSRCRIVHALCLTNTGFEPEFITTMTSIKHKMLSLQPPCVQLSTIKLRAGPMLSQRWFVWDKCQCATVITVVKDSFYYC